MALWGWKTLWQQQEMVLTREQIAEAQAVLASIRRPKVADVMDEIERVLNDHSQAIQTVEGFMEQHAIRAAASPDPQRLQAVLEKIQNHTARLSALMQKYPVAK